MKLCAHVIDGSAEALRLTVAGRSPAVKLVGGFSHAAEWKVDNPARLVWARYVPGPDDLWRRMSPEQFYADHIRPQVTHPANAAIDAWETGVNEDYRKSQGETPDYGDMAVRASFEATLAALIRADGRRPVVGQFAVGTPSGTPEEQRRAWRAYGQAILAARAYGGYVSLHAYGNVSGWTGPLDALVAVMGELGASASVLISECGHEPGWRDAGLAPSDYAAQLMAFDQTLQRYPAVLAAAIFAYGNTGERWAGYTSDHAAVTDALIAYGQAVPPGPVPEQPAFRFDGSGLRMYLYNAPRGRLVKVVAAKWLVDVYETQGDWWRVTTAPSRLWVRMAFA